MSTPIKSLVLFVLNLMFIIVSAHGPRRIAYARLKRITFLANQSTSYRLALPVPQLRCIDTEFDCAQFNLTKVQCRKYGLEEDWQCKSGGLSKEYQFGSTVVICEGFYGLYDDEYLLEGSCGLEFTVELMQDSDRSQSAINMVWMDWFFIGAVAFLLIMAGFACVDGYSHSHGYGYDYTNPRNDTHHYHYFYNEPLYYNDYYPEHDYDGNDSTKPMVELEPDESEDPEQLLVEQLQDNNN